MFSNFFYDAKAIIKGGKDYPRIKGMVYFKETKEGVLLTAKIHGLPQSKIKCTGRFFGFHIHSGNSCTGTKEDEFANSGTHYENNGYADMTVLINKFKIDDIIGKVLIIHDSPDDFNSQPSGNSGKKIACGKIT